MNTVTLTINYTDGEIVEKEFDMLKEALDYIDLHIIQKREYADKNTIEID